MDSNPRRDLPEKTWSHIINSLSFLADEALTTDVTSFRGVAERPHHVGEVGAGQATQVSVILMFVQHRQRTICGHLENEPGSQLDSYLT